MAVHPEADNQREKTSNYKVRGFSLVTDFDTASPGIGGKFP
jgi:hypothetical protein